MNSTVKWLLEGEPWVEYRTRLDLLNQSEGDPEVRDARARTVSHPLIQALLSEFTKWEQQIISNHKSAGLLLHKLCFLADIGFTAGDEAVKGIVEVLMRHITREGVVQVPINVPVHFGGTGMDSWGWCLCDTPTVMYALARFGLKDDTSIKNAVGYLKGLSRKNGWGCVVSPELGKFRGPGRKEDPCPYATLIMLKLLLQFDEYRNSVECRNGAESLLKCWSDSMNSHPYMFYMGTDFRKLKAPFIWYDILHVADVLSRCEWLENDARLKEMVMLVKSCADEEGRYMPQSEWKAWKDWDFSQKKKPSHWLTFLVLRLVGRCHIPNTL